MATVGSGLQDSEHGGLPSPPSFSLRAFYLERSNLPTDASTTAVKIDQVVPPPPLPAVELGQGGGQGGTPVRIPAEQPEASAAPPPGSLQGSSFPTVGISAFPHHCGISSMTYLHGTHSPLSPRDPGLLQHFSEAGARSGHAAVFLFANLLPAFKNQKISQELEASGFS